MKWYLRACPACGGDLHDDLEIRGWVKCFLCGRAFAVAELQTERERAEATSLGEPEQVRKAA